jgi:hypothetical protein
MSDSERSVEGSKTMNIFFCKNSFKNHQVWQHDRMTLEAKIILFFNNPRYHGRHTQVHKHEARYGITFVQDILSGSYRFTSVLTFTRDEQRANEEISKQT